jgi:hypothetical protein
MQFWNPHPDDTTLTLGVYSSLFHNPNLYYSFSHFYHLSCLVTSLLSDLIIPTACSQKLRHFLNRSPFIYQKEILFIRLIIHPNLSSYKIWMTVLPCLGLPIQGTSSVKYTVVLLPFQAALTSFVLSIPCNYLSKKASIKNSRAIYIHRGLRSWKDKTSNLTANVPNHVIAFNTMMRSYRPKNRKSSGKKGWHTAITNAMTPVITV